METKEIQLTIDNPLLDQYSQVYFEQFPRRRKKPIARPIHESLNVWSSMQRTAKNQLKQQWSDFIIWWMERENLSDARIEDYEIEFRTYMPTRRRADPDNTAPKFILDGMVRAGFLVDDDCFHMRRLVLSVGYDRDNPRTEITVRIFNHTEERK